MNNELFVATDLGTLKIYKLIPTNPGMRPKIEMIERLETEIRHPVASLVTDTPGIFHTSAPSESRGSGEHHELELEFERRALDRISDRINQTVRWNPDCADWHIAVSSEIQDRLLHRLSSVCHTRLRHVFSENLVNATKHEIVERLEEAGRAEIHH
jgi:hypothetical protein